MEYLVLLHTNYFHNTSLKAVLLKHNVIFFKLKGFKQMVFY